MGMESSTTRNVGLSVLAVAMIAFATWRFLGSSGKVRVADQFTAKGVCLSCKQEGEALYKKGERPPYKCAACDQQAFVMWWFCNDCHYRFIPEFVKEGASPARPTAFPKCTHCNCASVSGWDTENPAHAARGDAKLPKWPP